MVASFSKDVEPRADKLSSSLLPQNVHSTVLLERLLSAHQQLLDVAMMVVSTTFPG